MSKTLREHIVETVEQYKAPPHDSSIKGIGGNLTQEAIERTYQSVAVDLECILKITEGEEMDKPKINLIENEISNLLDKIEDLKSAVADLNQEMSGEKEESLWGRGVYYEGEYGIIVYDKPSDDNKILITLKGSEQGNMRLVTIDRLTLVPETIEDEREFSQWVFPVGSVLFDADDALYFKRQSGWGAFGGLGEDTIMFPAKVVKWNG